MRITGILLVLYIPNVFQVIMILLVVIGLVLELEL